MTKDGSKIHIAFHSKNTGRIKTERVLKSEGICSGHDKVSGSVWYDFNAKKEKG